MMKMWVTSSETRNYCAVDNRLCTLIDANRQKLDNEQMIQLIYGFDVYNNPKDMVEYYFKPANSTADLVVYHNYPSLKDSKVVFPAITIPTTKKQFIATGHNHLVLFKPKSEAPVHLLHDKHALEEIHGQILRTSECHVSHFAYKGENKPKLDDFLVLVEG